MKKIISFLLTINILLLMIPNAISKIAIIIGLSSSFLVNIFRFTLLSFLMLIVFQSILENKFRSNINDIYINLNYVMYFILMLTSFYVTSIISLQPFSWRITGYFLLLISFFLLSITGLRLSFSINSMYWAIISYTIPNSILGIIQYISANPIVPIIDQNGQSMTAAIRLDDIGSLGFLGRNGGYRAFGIFDSGMSLGLFLLLSLAVLFYGKIKISKSLKILLETLFIVTIVATLTRNVYICFIILVILNKIKSYNLKKMVFFVGIGLQFLAIGFANLLNSLQFFQSDFFSTLRSRYRGFIFFQNYYPHSLETTLFGHGYQYDSLVKVMTSNTVDNQIYATFLDLGLVGALIIFLLIIKGLNLGLKSDAEAFVNMLIVFAYFGIANNHIIFLSGILLLQLLYIKTEIHPK
jgi:hypothetical protein